MPLTDFFGDWLCGTLGGVLTLLLLWTIRLRRQLKNPRRGWTMRRSDNWRARAG